MASTGPSPLASSTEKTNGTKLRRLLVDGGTTVLREVFDGIHPPTKLSACLHSNNATLDDLFAHGILSKQQRELLFPSDGSNTDSKTFDITLLFLLLTEICGLAPPPRTGWNNKPHAKNKSLEANLVRVKLFRNKLIHTPEIGIDTRLFDELWKEISSVLVALGLGLAEIDRLKAERCGEEDYDDVLYKWADREKDVKSMVDELRQSQTKAHKAVERVSQTQQDHQVVLQDVSKAVETVGETQQKQNVLLQDTNKAVETVCQTQQEDHRTLQDTQKNVRDVRLLHEDTHHVVKEILKIQQEVRQKQQEVSPTQQETRQIQEEDNRTLQNTYKVVEDMWHSHQDTHQVIDQVLKTQQEAFGAVQIVCQTQKENRRTLEDTHEATESVRQIHQVTHQVVKEILKSQQEARQSQEEDRKTLQDTLQEVDDLRQIHQDTQQVVQDVLKAQQETGQTKQEAHVTIQEVAKTQKENLETLQQVKKTVDQITKGRTYNDKEDEILRKLAMINTQKVIEYHAERYQEGTRVSFFERVEKWLDDRSSSNRVMVISGSAGMGKSVISAVVCKRMQEARRLSGSHFCQHDKARNRNGKVMLQSLACQLADSLPEYKHILVKTLSRNLGVELNNMEVKDLFELFIEEPLSELKDPGRNILMVIDGLDESEYQGRNELLDIITNHFTKLPRWIRFLVTSRPEINIADSLKSFKPLQLEPSDKENLKDLKLLFEKRLSEEVFLEDYQEGVVPELVKKSEGLILFANLLVEFIKENVLLLTPEQLDSTLPAGISSIYQTYFQRLETELCKELRIEEEQFLTFLSALTAAREPLPLDFVTKVMVSGTSSLADRRKVKKVIACISALLPVHDGCIHFFHKSVRDWLTDTASYEQHDFTVDEKEGHRTLSELCADELDDIKKKGVTSAQFSDTTKYSLQHGVQHMLHLQKNARACDLEVVVRKYVVDLELIYAKLRLPSATASEDILWIQNQELSRGLSEDSKGMLNTLIFVLRKYFNTFTNLPDVFFQTVLNEGGTVLSPQASNLLQKKYLNMPHMEYVHKDAQQSAVKARFHCLSRVACFDVSPQLDYMACECEDGTIQLWSLYTGKQVWVRPVMVKKRHFYRFGAYRISPSSSAVLSFFRSVVFHPTADVVLPGVLSHAYTFDGDLKPLFPESNCSFTVCSISGDKTKMLTDCPDDAKCIIMWSLKNGTEVTRISRNEGVLSFAWSRDGKLLAISHATGSVCLVDVMDGCRMLVQTATPKECGMIKLSPDNRFLFCWLKPLNELNQCLFRLNINMAEHPSCVLDVSGNCYVPWRVESRSEGGFLFGDLLTYLFEGEKSSSGFFDWAFDFVLNEETVLRGYPHEIFVDMLNINEVVKADREATYSSIENIVFSLRGEMIYIVNYENAPAIKAWDVSSGELIAEKSSGVSRGSWKRFRQENYLLAVRKGVFFKTTWGTPELWNFELSKCVRSWTSLEGTERIIPISGDLERVACVGWDKVIIVDTTSGKIVSTVPTDGRHLIACNSKCHLLTYRMYYPLHLSDGKTTLWKKDLLLHSFRPLSDDIPFGLFSPAERFALIGAHHQGMCVLDAVSGETLHTLCKGGQLFDCKFVSDEECVISSNALSGAYCLKIFNVKSGDLLSVINLEAPVNCLAACPRKRLLAIEQYGSKHGFKLIQVHLPQDKDSRKSKW